jgi:hypothetical protein
MNRLLQVLLAACSLVLLGADAPPEKPQSPDAAAVAAIKTLGAQVDLDNEGYIVSVNFRENQKLADADLAALDKLSRLRFLSLHNTPITDAGLAHLEKLTSLQTLLLGKPKSATRASCISRGLPSCRR